MGTKGKGNGKKSERKIFWNLKKTDQIPVKTMYRNLQNMIPVTRISPSGIFECGVGLYSVCFRLQDTNFSIKTFREQVYFLENWCHLISSFDTRFKVTIFNKKRDMEEFCSQILYSTKDRYLKILEDSYNEIIVQSMGNCREGIEPEIYLTVTVQRKTIQSAEEYIKVLENDLAGTFSDLDVEITKLSAEERLECLQDFYRIFQQEKQKICLDEYITSGRDWKNDIVGKSIDLSDPEWMRLDGHYIKAFYLDPDSFSTDMTDKFYRKLNQIACKSLITTDYVPIPKSVAIKMMEIKSGGIESEISKQQDKRNESGHFTNDITLSVRQKKEQLEKKYKKLKESDLGTFWVGFVIVLIAETRNELNVAKEELQQICNEAGVQCRVYRNQQLEAVNTALPIGCLQVNQMRTFSGSEAGIYIPFNVKECQQRNRPLYYGFNQESKQPILLNRKKLMNGNGFVFAPPGYGKSFTGAKFEMGGVLLNETDHIIIMDPSNEYIDVVKAYHGEVLEFSEDSDLCINPFDVNLLELQQGMSKQKIQNLCKNKSHMMFSICQGILKELFNIRHKNILERSVRILYKKIISLSPKEMYIPIMSDFYEILKEQPEEEVEDLLISLEMFVVGSLNMFNGQTNVDVDNRVITFSIRDIDEELWPVAMSVIFDFITKRLMKNFKNQIATRLYIDEFHIFADEEFTCLYFLRCWRTWRKFQGFCTGITQNIKPVLENTKLATLVDNSDYLMLLHQSDNDFQIMLDTFSWITDAHRRYLLKAKPGTGLIKAGDNIIPFDNQVEKSSYVYSIYNTNAVEVAEKSS